MPLRFDATRSAVDNRLTRPSTTEARHCGAGPPKKGEAKFSCLQRIEKAQNGEIISAAGDGLGATNQGQRPPARRRICIRGGAAPPSIAEWMTGI